MIDNLAAMQTEHLVRFGYLAALAIELATIVLRFGWGMRSPETTKCCARFTGGWRIHHGYVGVALLVLAWALPLPAAASALLWISGIALALSDALHHFAVLWPLTGSPEFHVRALPSASSGT